ncbi:hypothetical protein M8C13_32725 [Crossiella sp. SN42]|uniref:hypothetical protein n=1 Tax=Crossiella sp. SN42 TaxID=2944808 RepID=UPI00207CF808|nr:hypothetical protein [Crossiella sp. SN42]MCO1580530.1 hypothetical protein [Crossiella sp. SN42]
MKVTLTSTQAGALASCIGDLELMAGRTVHDPACPVRGGFVCMSAGNGRFTLRAAENEPYVLAQISVTAAVDEPGQAWVATLPLADLLTKRPAAAADLELTATPAAGCVQVVFRTDTGRTIRVRQAAAMAVTEDNALRTVTSGPSDPVFSVPLTPDLVASLIGQVRQHEDLTSDRPRAVWLTLEASQLRLEAWLSRFEATAVDFPLPQAPTMAGWLTESFGMLLGRAAARISKVVDRAPGVMEIRTMLSNSVDRQCLILRADPYEFMLPLTKVDNAGITQKIHRLRHCLASASTVTVEVDGAGGLISQICQESTGALRHPRAVLDFYDRNGEQMLLVHVADDVSSEGPAAEIYSGEYPVVMSAPFNRRMALDHRKLAAALTVFRRHPRILLHAEPAGTDGATLLGITPAAQNANPITEFQASDIRTILAILLQAPTRLAPYADTGPIPRL